MAKKFVKLIKVTESTGGSENTRTDRVVCVNLISVNISTNVYYNTEASPNVNQIIGYGDGQCWVALPKGTKIRLVTYSASYQSAFVHAKSEQLGGTLNTTLNGKYRYIGDWFTLDEDIFDVEIKYYVENSPGGGA